MTLAARVSLPVLQEPRLPRRPRTRGDCANSPRPCPWVSCRYSLFLEVTPDGLLKLNFPDREVSDLADTCALDVADRAAASRSEVPDDHGALGLREVGAFLGIGLERARQIEKAAIRILKAHQPDLGGNDPPKRLRQAK